MARVAEKAAEAQRIEEAKWRDADLPICTCGGYDECKRCPEQARRNQEAK